MPLECTKITGRKRLGCILKEYSANPSGVCPFYIYAGNDYGERLFNKSAEHLSIMLICRESFMSVPLMNCPVRESPRASFLSVP